MSSKLLLLTWMAVIIRLNNSSRTFSLVSLSIFLIWSDLRSSIVLLFIDDSSRLIFSNFLMISNNLFRWSESSEMRLISSSNICSKVSRAFSIFWLLLSEWWDISILSTWVGSFDSFCKSVNCDISSFCSAIVVSALVSSKSFWSTSFFNRWFSLFNKEKYLLSSCNSLFVFFWFSLASFAFWSANNFCNRWISFSAFCLIHCWFFYNETLKFNFHLVL